MREHPLLFSAPMVRALLAGTKVQTRRLVTASNCIVNGEKRWRAERFARFPLDKAWMDRGPSPAGNPGPYLKCDSTAPEDDGAMARLYPPWQVGDRIWVKETHRFHAWLHMGEDAALDVEYPATNSWWRNIKTPKSFVYDLSGQPLRPSIFLPRWASRITLEVTEVRAERLNDISEADALAEGITMSPTSPSARHEYALLWEKINGAGSWAKNEWVWAISFRRVTP